MWVFASSYLDRAVTSDQLRTGNISCIGQGGGSGGAEWRDLQFVLPWRILTANTSRLGSRIVPPVVRPRKRIHHRPYEKGESRKHLLALDRMVCSIL
jgi:hypothetical protein